MSILPCICYWFIIRTPGTPSSVSDRCNADQTYETIKTSIPTSVIAGFVTKTSLMSCYRHCEHPEEHLVSIYYKSSTMKCGCFYQNAYRIIRVKTTSKDNFLTAEDDVTFYIAPLSDQSRCYPIFYHFKYVKFSFMLLSYLRGGRGV